MLVFMQLRVQLAFCFHPQEPTGPSLCSQCVHPLVCADVYTSHLALLSSLRFVWVYFPDCATPLDASLPFVVSAAPLSLELHANMLRVHLIPLSASLLMLLNITSSNMDSPPGHRAVDHNSLDASMQSISYPPNNPLFKFFSLQFSGNHVLWDTFWCMLTYADTSKEDFCSPKLSFFVHSQAFPSTGSAPWSSHFWGQTTWRQECTKEVWITISKSSVRWQQSFTPLVVLDVRQSCRTLVRYGPLQVHGKPQFLRQVQNLSHGKSLPTVSSTHHFVRMLFQYFVTQASHIQTSSHLCHAIES